MPKQHITQRFLNALTPPPPQPNGQPAHVFYRDTAIPGFAVRLTSGGACSYIFEHRVPGRRSARRITLGPAAALTLEKARKKAMSLLGEVADGADPIKKRERKALGEMTLGDALETYLAARRELKPSTAAYYRKDIRWGARDWMESPLRSIDREQILDRHAELSARSPSRANGCFRVLRAVFNHMRKRHHDEEGAPLFPINPTEILRDIKAWNTVRPRTRYLRDVDLPKWYAATLKLNNENTRDYLHLVLLTGLRKMEGARIRWTEVDFEAGTLLIPDTKNRDPHLLPLSTQLDELLQRRFEARTSPYVFPSDSQSGHLTEPRTAIARVGDLSGVPFTLHDLRRTFATVAARLDMPHYAVKRLLNHRLPDITADYIQLDADRLRVPMQRVSDELWEIMTGERGQVLRFPGKTSTNEGEKHGSA